MVHRVIGGLVWCARRWDERGDVINSGSAAGLSEAIELAQQQG